jgi:hypothetical protein
MRVGVARKEITIDLTAKMRKLKKRVLLLLSAALPHAAVHEDDHVLRRCQWTAYSRTCRVVSIALHIRCFHDNK